jgi:hypothetical protein
MTELNRKIEIEGTNCSGQLLIKAAIGRVGLQKYETPNGKSSFEEVGSNTLAQYARSALYRPILKSMPSENNAENICDLIIGTVTQAWVENDSAYIRAVVIDKAAFTAGELKNKSINGKYQVTFRRVAEKVHQASREAMYFSIED